LERELAYTKESLQATIEEQQASNEELKSTNEELQSTNEELETSKQAIETHIAAHPDLQRDRGLLQSIPGVGAAVVRVLLPILQPERFDSARQAAAYLGLVPIERQSGTSVKGRSRLSKAGDSRVRATLYLPALVATRCNPHIRALYERLLAHETCKMAALGACRHVSCYISVLAF
jgi:transposase